MYYVSPKIAYSYTVADLSTTLHAFYLFILLWFRTRGTQIYKLLCITIISLISFNVKLLAGNTGKPSLKFIVSIRNSSVLFELRSYASNTDMSYRLMQKKETLRPIKENLLVSVIPCNATKRMSGEP